MFTTSTSSLSATGPSESPEQLEMLGVPGKQPFRMELYGQQVRQHSACFRRQFHAFNDSIPADCGCAQAPGQPGDGLVVRTVHTEAFLACNPRNQRTRLTPDVMDHPVLSIRAAVVHCLRYLERNIGKESAS